MIARMQKHRMMRWMGRVFVVLSLVASWGAQAAVEYVPPDSGWNYGYGGATSGLVNCKTSEMAIQGLMAHICDFYKASGAVDSCYLDSVFPPREESWHGINYTVIEFYFYGTKAGDRPLGLPGVVNNLPTCPVPVINPDFRYQFIPATGMCERNVQDTITLTITLSGGTEVEPSKGSDLKTLPIIATVKDQSTGQPPTNPVKVHISLKVDPKSGGHDHGDDTRPRGGIANVKTCASDAECWPGTSGDNSNTDGNGQVVFNFNAPEASGTHTISATCEGCSNTATKPVDVKVDGLLPILDSVYYALTESDGKGGIKNIGDNGNHSGNHYLTSVASMKVWQVARNFYEYQIQKGIANPTLLHLNDASLKWGGKFDIKGKWVGYHYKHDRGVVIDIRANTINEGTGSTPGSSIPESMFIDFETMAAKNEVNAKLHCSADRDPAIDNCVGDLNRHYHVILN